MRSILRMTSVGVALALGFTAVAAAGPVEDRQAMMKAIGPLMGQAKAVSTPETYDAAKAKAAMSAVAADAKKMSKLFGAGTTGGASDQKVWDNAADFNKRMAEFVTLAEKAAAATTIEAYAPAFKEASATCKSCHDIYRKKK